MIRKKNPLLEQEKPKPVIEVEQKRSVGRIVLLVVCLAVAVIALGTWLHDLVTVDPGWYTISADTTEANCGSAFLFKYEVGGNAKEEKKGVTKAYTQACKEAQALFYWDVETPAEGGIRYISDNPNRELTVDSSLYSALALAAESPLLYMGPITAEYSRIFQYEEEHLAAQCDPGQNPQIMAYVTELTAFAGSREHIRLELLGNNRVRLFVSGEYLDFARENGVEALLDFGWMTNAFVADYLAAALTAAGYTQGYLVSYDGFGRYLGGSYTLGMTDRFGNDIYRAAVYTVQGPTSTVSFRNYPLPDNGADAWRYFAFRNGRIASVFTDPTDGVCKSATDNLLCYSQSASCAELVLSCGPLFLTEQLEEGGLLALAKTGIHTVWAEGKQLRYTDSSLVLAIEEGTGYTKKCVTE